MNDSQLAATMKEALQIRDRMKAEGHPPAEIDRYLEGVLREAWPKGRVWRHLCDECDDTGLIMLRCRRGQRCNGVSTRTDTPHETPGKYARLCAKHPDSDYAHDYGIPCQCRAGARFRPAERAAPSVDDAGAVPRKPTRVGR